MILKTAYDEIMEKIEVTDEMRKRILENIEATDIKKLPNVIRFSAYKKYLSIAACLAVMLMGAITLPQLLKMEEIKPNPILTNPNASIVECATLQELTSIVGFPVSELSNMPFEPTEVTYNVYCDTLAEIVYRNEIQSAIFRISIGNEDISGDFNTYPSVAEITIQSNTIQLKGNDEIYCLAIWSNGTYSYSIRLTNGVSENVWHALLSQFNSK